MDAIKNFTTIHLQLNQINIFGNHITLNDLPNKVCVPNKTEDLNISVFNMSRKH